MYDDDYADEEWVEDEGEPEDDVLACPSCGNAVHEDTQQCPHCGDWITPVWPGARSRRLVWIVAAAIAILGMLAVTLC